MEYPATSIIAMKRRVQNYALKAIIFAAGVGWMHFLLPTEAWVFSDVASSSHSTKSQRLAETVSISDTHNDFKSVDRRGALSIFSVAVASLGMQTADARNLPASTGADTSKVGTAEALAHIVRLRNNMKQLKGLLGEEYRRIQPQNDESTRQTSSAFISSQLPRDEKIFKRLFDAYSDQVSYKQKFMDQNAFLVYYSQGYDGPGRKKMEEGEVENERQTLQFGARNEAWVAWEEFLAEYDYHQKILLSTSYNKDEELEEFAEMQKALSRAISAVNAYLALAPQEDATYAEKVQ